MNYAGRSGNAWNGYEFGALVGGIVKDSMSRPPLEILGFKGPCRVVLFSRFGTILKPANFLQQLEIPTTYQLIKD